MLAMTHDMTHDIDAKIDVTTNATIETTVKTPTTRFAKSLGRHADGSPNRLVSCSVRKAAIRKGWVVDMGGKLRRRIEVIGH